MKTLTFAIVLLKINGWNWNLFWKELGIDFSKARSLRNVIFLVLCKATQTFLGIWELGSSLIHKSLWLPLNHKWRKRPCPVKQSHQTYPKIDTCTSISRLNGIIQNEEHTWSQQRLASFSLQGMKQETKTASNSFTGVSESQCKSATSNNLNNNDNNAVCDTPPHARITLFVRMLNEREL